MRAHTHTHRVSCTLFFCLSLKINPIFAHKDSFFFLMDTYHYKTFHIYAKHIKTNIKNIHVPTTYFKK